jgi:hypothetical protein
MILVTIAIVTTAERQHSCGALVDSRKSSSSTGLNLDTVVESVRITIFKIVIFLNQLGNLMICTHDLIVLIKKRNDPILRTVHVRWQKNAINSYF